MSEYTAVTLEPTTPVEAVRPDTVGFYAMPVLADLNNTGNRIQTMVDHLGIPFVMSDLFAQKKRTVFGYEAKHANQVHGDIYREMSLRRLDFVHEQLSRLGMDTALAMGDSLGVPAVQGMQLFAEPERRFNALLLRDGWNLKPEVGKVRGVARYAIYQGKDAAFSSGEREVTDYGFEQRDLDEEDETSLPKKLANVADTMRGPENRKNALALAGRAATEGAGVLNIVCLNQGLSGSEADVKLFIGDLHTAYNNANREQPLEQRGHIRMRAWRRDGWHSDLMDPALGAADVRDTLSLL